MSRIAWTHFTAGLALALCATASLALASPGQPITRIGALELQPGEGQPTGAAFDSKRGYVYFLSASNPIRVIKIRAATATQPASVVARLTLNAGESGATIQSAAIDVERGHLYVAAYTPAPGRIVKLKVGEGDAAPERLGALILNAGEEDLASIAIDSVNGYGYVSEDAVNPQVIKFALGEGDALPTRIGAALLNTSPDQGYVFGLAVDPAARRVYAAGLEGLTILDAGDGNLAPTAISHFRYLGNILTTYCLSCHFDPMRRQATAMDYTMGGGPVLVDVSGETPLLVGHSGARDVLSRVLALAVDPYNDVFYSASDAASPNFVTKWRMAPSGLLPAVEFAVQAQPTDFFHYTGAVDPVNGFIYYGNQGGVLGQILIYRQEVDTLLPHIVSALAPPKVTTKDTTSRISASASLRNDSGNSIGPLKVRAYLSADRELGYDDLQIGKDISVKAIKPGKTRKVSFKGAFPGPVAGKYVILAPDIEGAAPMQNRATAFALSEPLP